jgi:hypothetical protein
MIEVEEDPRCFGYDLVRRLEDVESLTISYQLRTLVCPQCQSVLKLVCRKLRMR